MSNPAGPIDSESEDDFNPEPEVDSGDEAVRAQAPTRERGSPSNRGEKSPRQEDVHDEPLTDRQYVDQEDPKVDNRRTTDAEDEGGDDENENAEEEEDEEDDDDEVDGDEDEVRGHRRKRHKRDRRNMFVDVEAEVEDEDEELEEEDDDLGGEAFLADTHPDDELPVGDVSDDRRHRELDRARQAQEDLDAEKAAALMRERYGRNRVSAVDAVVVPQRLLLPSVEDPTIWGVRCKPGKEREVVFALMKRLQDRAHTREPLQITAAFERGGTMTGFVYIEARKQADVITACDALPSAYPRNNMVLVPINEMPDLLKTQKTKSLEPGMYVRMKRGRYQGDLAQVEEVETNGLEVEVRLVPRLDYGAAEDPNAPMITNGPIGPAAKRKRQNAIGKTLSTRPPQRLFSDVDARKKHARHLQQVSSYNKKQFQYLGDTYIGGFLVKSFKIQLLQTEDVNPTLEEVTKFTAGAEDGTENLDLAAIAATLKASNASTNYLPGDMVEIFHGEQRGVCGKAITVHGDIVSIRVTDGELRGQLLDAPVKGLRKRFREGDHVKVIGGSKYHDEVGMVVRIKDDRVTLLSDSTNQEITVFSKDLRAATDAGTAGSDSKYDLYDLVQLDPSTVGCVVKVDRESLRVLDQFGSTRVLLPSNISNKLGQRRFAVATDRDGTEIRGEDTVKEVSGEQRQGRVLHIHRLYLFLQNRQQTENAGIFVTRNSNVVTVAAKGMRPANAGPDLSKMNPLAQRGAGGGASMAPPKSFGRDRLLGKTVVIRKGPNKGLLGIVKDANDTDARVELHTKKNLVSVAKENLSVKDPVSGQTIDFARFSGGGRGGGGVGGGPFSGRPGATPSRVPAGWDHEGSRTPSAFNNGGKTPAWGATGGGSRTPGWSRSGGGGGGGYPSGAGSRTPAAWGDGSRTANPYADGSRTAYGGATSYGGASTWNPNSSTPFHTSSASSSANASAGFSGSRTPAAWDAAPTPAARAFDAPTPGVSTAQGGAPTPRYGGAYGTPAAAAPTPGGGFAAESSGYGGGGAAMTPGFGAEAEEEGYE